jgi:hypothetical protein
VLDKLDLHVPDGVPPGPVLAPLFEQLRHGPVETFRPSRFYQFVGDLRKYHGIDAIVSLYYRFGRPAHKVEIIDAGKKSLGEMAEIVTLLFDVDLSKLRVMRVDLAADLEGVPVKWFRDHVRVDRKRFSSRIEKSQETEVEFVAMANALAQTLYAGKRPNLVRIYNKLAEWYRNWLKMVRALRRFNAGLDAFDMTSEKKCAAYRVEPTFKDYCEAEGYELSEGSILTRVERQIGADRVPDELATFGDLRRAYDFRPFEGLRIIESGPILQISAPPRDVPLGKLLAALGFEKLKEHFGSAQAATAFVMKFGNGNGKRILTSLADALPGDRPPVTLEEIQESFRKSTEWQIFGSPHDKREDRADGSILTPYVCQGEPNCRERHLNSFESMGVQVV